jgi:hypothetical protein
MHLAAAAWPRHKVLAPSGQCTRCWLQSGCTRGCTGQQQRAGSNWVPPGQGNRYGTLQARKQMVLYWSRVHASSFTDQALCYQSLNRRHSFVSSAVNRGESLASADVALGNEFPVTVGYDGWVDPRASLNAVAKRTVPLPGKNQTPAIQLHMK